MKITRRQMQQLADIVQEELTQRKSLHEGMYRDRRQSYVNESEVHDSMSPDDLSTAVSSILESEVVEAGLGLRVDFDKKLFKELSRLVAQAGGERITAATLQDDLEDFDADGLMELQMELSTDISAALEKYVSQVSLLVTHAKLSGVG
jgi:hypothetical protein